MLVVWREIARGDPLTILAQSGTIGEQFQTGDTGALELHLRTPVSAEWVQWLEQQLRAVTSAIVSVVQQAATLVRVVFQVQSPIPWIILTALVTLGVLALVWLVSVLKGEPVLQVAALGLVFLGCAAVVLSVVRPPGR